MGKILNILEAQLKDQLLEGETLKSWTKWCQWLKSQKCPFQLKRPAHLPKDRIMNYQTLLEACDSQMTNHPEWQARLCTPSWLQRQHIKVVPSILKKGYNSKGSEFKSLKTELSQLVDHIHKLQREIDHLELNPQNSPQIAQEISMASQSPKETAGKGLYRSGETALFLKRELSSPSFQVKSPKTNSYEGTVPLNDAYLNYNRWIDQFEYQKIDLESFCSKQLRVESSHEISYTQFCHRLLREVTENESLTDLFKRFEKQCMERVNLTLPEKTFDGNILKTQNFNFRLPEDDVYHNFPEWLEWLKDSGLDISQFTSEDLSSISSHRISFLQFCRRLERRLDDPQGFRQQLENR